MHAKLLIAGLSGPIALSVAGAAFADTTFLPGLYETRISYPDDGPDVETARECLTPAAAAQESLERRLTEAVRDGNCTFSRRRIGQGTFDIAGSCNLDGARSSIEQSGTFSPTSMTMNLRTTVAPAPGARPVSVTMVMTSRRLSASCPAGSDEG